MGKKQKKNRKPNLDRELTLNPAEAEVADFNIYFTWHSIPLTIDVKTVDLARWTYAVRRVGNDNLPLQSRVNAMIDTLEATLGELQTSDLVDAEPTLLSDPELISDFWESFIKAVHGRSPGES
jgi:hypothetical protein